MANPPSIRGPSWLTNLRARVEIVESETPGAGTHICTAAEENAGSVSISHEIENPLGFIVQICREGKMVTQAFARSMENGVITIANSPPFSIKEDDVICWIAY
jgi:hypothetical protein